MNTRPMLKLGEVRCVFAKYDEETNLEELVRNHMSDYDNNSEYVRPAILIFLRPISRVGA